MIEVRGLKKSYGSFTALNGLDLTVSEGSIYGFIGQNGAGKTTSIRILATLLTPDSGKLAVAGLDPTTNPYDVRRRIGYVPDFFGLYEDFKVGEYLDFFADAHHVPLAERNALKLDLLELVGLRAKEESYVDSLSRGMKQRLGLARALVHNPSVLLLDEPASGLDPRARVEVREILKELGRMGKTVLISSHILGELAEVCDTIGIVHAGRMVAEGPLQEILRRGQGIVYRLSFLGNQPDAQQWLAQRGLEVLNLESDGLEVTFDGEQQAANLLAGLTAAGFAVSCFAPQQGNLEELFMELTGEEDLHD